ncbi:MAG TPA: hypothetical protein VD963_09945 [Phycisphaerales bacterium]|nr:hypothetical protein [Phycisphaerales bacterium]
MSLKFPTAGAGEPLARPAPVPSGAARADEFDALASMFLGAPAVVPAPAAPPSAAPRPARAAAVPTAARARGRGGAPLHLLVCAHLPVLASAWTAQFARTVARSATGPVGLVRLERVSLGIDLVGVPARTTSDPLRAAAPLDGVRVAGEHAAAWVLRAGAAGARRAWEATGAPVTVLTGADDAAVVAAYAVVRDLVAPGAPDDPEGEGPGPAIPATVPEIELVVVGAPAEQARAVAEKIAATANDFLGFRPRIGEPIPAITGGGKTVAVFRGPAEVGVDELVRHIRRATPSPALQSARLGGAGPGPARPAADRPGSHRAGGPAPALGPATEPRPGRPESLPASPARPPAVRSAAPPTSAPCAARPPAHLSSHVPGLAPLDLACPSVPAAEFAIDSSCHVHVLVACPGDPGPALALLLAARAWAGANHQLICRALNLALAPCPAVLHLLTAEPRSARALLETEVRVHARLTVQTPGGPVVATSPLN